jgi:hypothetical protein
MNQADPSSGPRTKLEVCVVAATKQLSIDSTQAHTLRHQHDDSRFQQYQTMRLLG